jgi:hypothetical protein
MSLYAWKYDTDGTVVYTLLDEPSSGDSIYKSNGVVYEESELHILYNNLDGTVVTPTIADVKIDQGGSGLLSLQILVSVQIGTITRAFPAYFVRYSDGDIFPVSKLKHNGITYEIVDEKARASIQNTPKFLTFTNVTASTWVSDSTYTDYGYKCVLTCTGTTSSDYAQVVFGPDQANSGNYANVCLTGTDSVTIYSKVDTSISIPTIIVMGAR